jgi:ATP-dependent 26S proteasome regulatory subunit
MIDSTTRFRQIFEIARVLSPAIICFDDLDLLVGERERMYDKDTLGDFLQQLDGFKKNNVFLLCTTNDKELIDKAASRPGRFDLVLDFGKINKDNYIEIIKSNCSDEAILNLFDKELLEDLRKKKVTGRS